MKKKSFFVSILTIGMMFSLAAPVQAKTIKGKFTIRKGKSMIVTLNGSKTAGKISVSKKKIIKVKKIKKNKWRVTGVKAGKTKLTIKAKKKKYIYTVTVKKKNTAKSKDGTILYVWNSNKENDIGIQEKNVSAANYFYMYSNTFSKNDIVYMSSKPSVAKLDQYGNLTPVSAGTTTITAKVGGLKATCKVTVHDVTINMPALPVTRTYSSMSYTNDFTVNQITLEKDYNSTSHKFIVEATLTGTLSSDSLAVIDYQLKDTNGSIADSGSFYPSTVNGVTAARTYISGDNELMEGKTYTLTQLNHSND